MNISNYDSMVSYPPGYKTASKIKILEDKFNNSALTDYTIEWGLRNEFLIYAHAYYLAKYVINIPFTLRMMRDQAIKGKQPDAILIEYMNDLNRFIEYNK